MRFFAARSLCSLSRCVCGAMLIMALSGASLQAQEVAAASTPTSGSLGLHRQPVTFDALAQGFSDPDLFYAPFTFWFWDEPLNADKAEAMAKEMLTQRLNPGYAHARIAMTPNSPSLPKEQWLSPQWFDALGRVAGQSEAAHGYIGYCDEYWWPSGQAAGRVLEQHPELRATSLRWETIDVPAGAAVNVPASFFAVAVRRAEALTTATAAPLTPTMGSWIWRPEGPGAVDAAYFRKTFELKSAAQPLRAALMVTADNQYTVYLNGQKVGADADWYKAETYDVKGLIRPGRNVIAVEGRNQEASLAGCGLTLGLRAELADGTAVDVATGSDWRVTGEPGADWTKPAVDDRAWVAARVIAPLEGEPWMFTQALNRHRPAKIHSDSLRLIGEGNGFTWRAPEGEDSWRVYTFNKYHRMGIDGGEVNYLDTRLAPVFLGLAHEPYVKAMGGRLGRTVPGVFCDNEGDDGFKLAWSDDLERHFKEKTGRDIRLALPLLVDNDVEGQAAKARWEWFDADSDLYADGFFRPLNAWAEAHGMHYISNLWEESLSLQALAVGDFMKLQRAFIMPGTDCLSLNGLGVHDQKETQSVAEFEGRLCMTEMMGAGGWGIFTPEKIRQVTNSVVARGVSHIVQHGIFMTRKFDGNPWPPDWFNENPLWPLMHLWTDYARRACYVNAHGQTVADVLLINPLESVWALAPPDAFDPAATNDQPGLAGLMAWYGPEVAQLDQVYAEAMKSLTAGRIEYLIADRYYLRRMQAQGGRLTMTGGPLNPAEYTFHTVILPPLVILPTDVAQKLVDFAEQGGRVYALGALPNGSAEHGLGDPAMQALMKRLAAAPAFKTLPGSLEAAIAAGAPGLRSQLVLESGAFPLLQLHRRIGGCDFFWLANGTDQEQRVTALLPGLRGFPEVWDCETGARRPLAADPASTAGLRVNLSFHPTQGYWLVIRPKAEPGMMVESEVSPLTSAARTLAGPWTVRIDPAAQPSLEHPLTPPAEFTQPGGTRRELGDWAAWGLAAFSGVVDYKTTFTLPASGAAGAATPVGTKIDLGQVQYGAQVWVNGRLAGERMWPPYVFDLTPMTRPGQNTLRVRVANLVNNSYGTPAPSGLIGPVRIE